jgi:transposase
VHDGIAMVELLVGLPGVRVLDVVQGDAELVVTIETTATVAWCPSCGVRAQAQDRTLRSVRDLPCFGRPARLEVMQRR